MSKYFFFCLTIMALAPHVVAADTGCECKIATEGCSYYGRGFGGSEELRKIPAEKINDMVAKGVYVITGCSSPEEGNSCQYSSCEVRTSSNPGKGWNPDTFVCNAPCKEKESGESSDFK